MLLVSQSNPGMWEHHRRCECHKDRIIGLPLEVVYHNCHNNYYLVVAPARSFYEFSYNVTLTTFVIIAWLTFVFPHFKGSFFSLLTNSGTIQYPFHKCPFCLWNCGGQNSKVPPKGLVFGINHWSCVIPSSWVLRRTVNTVDVTLMIVIWKRWRNFAGIINDPNQLILS